MIQLMECHICFAKKTEMKSICHQHDDVGNNRNHGESKNEKNDKNPHETATIENK